MKMYFSSFRIHFFLSFLSFPSRSAFVIVVHFVVCVFSSFFCSFSCCCCCCCRCCFRSLVVLSMLVFSHIFFHRFLRFLGNSEQLRAELNCCEYCKWQVSGEIYVCFALSVVSTYIHIWERESVVCCAYNVYRFILIRLLFSIIFFSPLFSAVVTL